MGVHIALVTQIASKASRAQRVGGCRRRTEGKPVIEGLDQCSRTSPNSHSTQGCASRPVRALSAGRSSVRTCPPSYLTIGARMPTETVSQSDVQESASQPVAGSQQALEPVRAEVSAAPSCALYRLYPSAEDIYRCNDRSFRNRTDCPSRNGRRVDTAVFVPY